MNEINFDANASYGVLPEVTDEVNKLLKTGIHNPSSLHFAGQRARGILDQARQSIKDLLQVDDNSRIVFTSGATESNNMAVFTALKAYCKTKQSAKVLYSEEEHHSVLEAISLAKELNPSLVVNGIKRGSYTVEEQLISSLSGDEKLICLMAANNETGEVYNTRQVKNAIRDLARSALLHVDAVQVVGRIPFSIESSGADTLTISGHKIGALSGIGALILTQSAMWHPLLVGGPQERRLRAGTENVVGIHSLGVAARCALEKLEKRRQAMLAAKEFAWRRIAAEIPAAKLVTTAKECLPNTLMIHIPTLISSDLIVACDLEGVLISSGAACASGKPEPSHVLLALGMSRESAKECVRLSFKGEHTNEELERGVASFIKAAKILVSGKGSN
jgi:cysteine desulfurase